MNFQVQPFNLLLNLLSPPSMSFLISLIQDSEVNLLITRITLKFFTLGYLFLNENDFYFFFTCIFFNDLRITYDFK